MLTEIEVCCLVFEMSLLKPFSTQLPTSLLGEQLPDPLLVIMIMIDLLVRNIPIISSVSTEFKRSSAAAVSDGFVTEPLAIERQHSGVS